MDTQDSDPTERVSERIYKLDRVDFISLLGDLCALRGWQPSLEVGNPQSAGDIAVVRRLPTPKSISIKCYDEELTESILRECWETHNGSDQSELTVVARGEVSTDAYSFAEEMQIGVLDPTDITAELFGLSATELLSEYYEEFELEPSSSPISEDDSKRSSGSSQPDTTDHDQIEYSPDHQTQNDSLILELRGFQYHTQEDEQEGVFFDLHLKCKSGTHKLRPSSFVLHGAGNLTGARVDESDVLQKLSGIVEPQWKIGEVEMSKSESINYLVYVPNKRRDMSGFTFMDLTLPLFQEEIARGLTEELSSVLDNLFGLE